MGLLDNKVAIVTGAASDRGMGQATVYKLAEEGARIVVTDRLQDGDDSHIKQVVTNLEKSGAEAMGIGVDVTNEEEINSCVDQVLKRFGQIDILFNNAGVPIGVGPFESISQSNWEKTFDVNLFGMVRFARAVLPHMKKKQSGVIINNASTLGLGGMPEFSAYGASKFAVVGLTKHLASEFGNSGIRVNCVCPGMIDTSMSDIEVEGYMEAHQLNRDEAIAALSTFVPLGKYGDPGEVADAVVFLASEKAAYITGVALPVAGGFPAGL